MNQRLRKAEREDKPELTEKMFGVRLDFMLRPTLTKLRNNELPKKESEPDSSAETVITNSV
jgi:hypothetical protein